MQDWQPPDHWLRFTTIDAHTAGEPLRIITGGFPDLPGNTILEKRQYARQHYDHLRRALMWEPRGHADMYGCILTPPVTPDGDIGVLFIHNEGFSTMCGHGIIGLVKVGVENGFFPIHEIENSPEKTSLAPSSSPRPEGEGSGVRVSQTVIKIDTPAGRVTATAHVRDGKVEHVSFLNVPSFLLERDLTLEVPGLGSVHCDIAFGGAFYAYVDVAPLNLDITPHNQSELIDVGMRIKRAVMASYTIHHPDGDPDLNFLYGTILVKMLNPSSETTSINTELDSASSPPLHAMGRGEGGGDFPPVHSRNVCVFAEGEVDRSPTGTGVSGRLAIHYAKGELALDETITIESLISTRFTGRVASTTSVNGFPAIIPEVSGTAYITGKHEFLIDPDDPLRDGFILR